MSSRNGGLLEAVSLSKDTFLTLQERLGDSHVETLRASCRLAGLYSRLGRQAEARAMLEQAAPLLAKELDERHVELSAARRALSDDDWFDISRGAEAMTARYLEEPPSGSPPLLPSPQLADLRTFAWVCQESLRLGRDTDVDPMEMYKQVLQKQLQVGQLDLEVAASNSEFENRWACGADARQDGM